MATLIIDKLHDATYTITHTDYYDLLLLPEAFGVSTRGQVISVFGSSDMLSVDNIDKFDFELEAFSVSTTKSDGKVSIGGNYVYNPLKVVDRIAQEYGYDGSTLAYWTLGTDNGVEYAIDFYFNYTYSGELKRLYEDIYPENQLVYKERKKDIDWANRPIFAASPDKYNVYHLSVNDDYITGAVMFGGAEGELVLTAQNGAGNADIYHTSTVDNSVKKQDDRIALRSDSYSLRPHYEVVERVQFVDILGNVTEGLEPTDLVFNGSDPLLHNNSFTISYTIYAKNKLTVSSDLAGIVESNVAALYSRYKYVTPSAIVTVCRGNDYNIIGAGVQADELVLASNFRATINVLNNTATFRYALGYSSDSLSDSSLADSGENKHGVITPTVYGGDITNIMWDVFDTTVQRPKDEKDSDLPADFDGGLRANGTTIAGVIIATGNVIRSYGLHAEKSISTAENSVWAGSITVDTSNTLINAGFDYLGKSFTGDELKSMRSSYGAPDASNNKVGAFGVRSEGSLYIARMGTVKNDSGYDQAASIVVNASGNTIAAEVDRYAEKRVASTTSDSEIIAAALYADTIKLGEVTNDVVLDVTSNDNLIYHFDDKATRIVGGEYGAFGIKANTLTLADFDGQIDIHSNMFLEGGALNNNEYIWNLDGAALQQIAGIKAGTLKSDTNLHGEITVTHLDENNHKWRNGMGIYASTLTVKGVIDTEIESAIGIYVANKWDADAFTGVINADMHGIAVNADSGKTINIAGEIYAYSGNYNGENYGIASYTELNLRVSGTITVGNTGSAVRAEYLVCPNAGGMSDINERKFDDNIELTASAKVDGDIDLGAGINTAVINSNASLKGVIKSGAGEVNITFELEEIPSNNRSTVVVEKFSEDDKTLKDSKTITINLNYAREGKYDLIEYKFDVSEYWVEKERNIAFKFQGNTYNVTMKETDPNSNSVCGSFTDINGVEVIARFERNIFSVEVKGELPAAREVKTTDFINEFAEEISMVKNDKLTLKWDMLDAWLKEKIDAGSLKLVDGQKLSEFTSYQVVYVLRDNEGNQIGGPRTVSVTGSSYNVNLLEAAIENNVAVKTIGSAKLISISVIGNTENGIQQGMTYDFSPLITEEVEETCSLTLEWSDEHDEFTDLLDKGKLYADNGATIRKNDPYHYEISVQAYSRTGKKLGNPVKFVVDGDKDSYAVSLQEMGEALDIKYTDIAAISLESVALVSDGKKATRQSDSKASRLEVELSWNELHDEWMEQIANGSLKNESGHDIKNFKNYELEIKLFDKEGTDLGSVNRVVADGAISYTANLSDLVNDISGDYLWSDIFSLQIEKVTLFDENDLSVESTGSFDEIQMVDLAGAGVLFNWDSLHYNLENKCKAGKLDDTAGNRVESLGNYTVSYILRDKNGNQIGSDVYTRTGIEGSNVKIYYAGHAGVKVEDIAEIEILSITCASTDINGNAGNVAHEFSQSATLVTYDAIKVKWTDRKDEFTTLLANNQLFDGNNKKIEEINGYVITVEAYDVSGEKLGNGKLYQYTVSGNIDECDLELQKIADALDIPYVQDIAKVKVVGVTVVGEELNDDESVNKLVQASEFTESNRIINLDWSDLNAEILAEGSINGITLATEDGIRAYELTVIFQDANGNQVGRPVILDDELIKKLAPGSTEEPYVTSYSIDVNAIAPELNIDPSTVYSARIQKFVVHVNDANGNKREVVIDCLTPARETKQNIAKTVLEWTELHAMLQNEMTPETYEITFVMKDESGNVLATANPLTFTVNSSEYTVYLKDYEYLLDGENTINDVAKLEIVKINVSGTDAGGNAVNRSFSGVEFVADTEFDDPEMTLDWYSIADDCKAQIAAGTLVGQNDEVVTGIKSYEITYVLRDKDGKQLGEIVEVTGLTYADYEVNLADAAKRLGIEFQTIAEVELASVVLVGTTASGDSSVVVYRKNEPDVIMPIRWEDSKFEAAAEFDEIAKYTLTYVLRDKDGKVIGSYNKVEVNEPYYEVNITEYRKNNGVTGDIDSVEIVQIDASGTIDGVESTVTIYDLVKSQEHIITLDWTGRFDEVAENFKTVESYTISFVLRDAKGKVIKTVDDVEVPGTVYDVDLVKVLEGTNVKMADVKDIELDKVVISGTDTNDAAIREVVYEIKSAEVIFTKTWDKSETTQIVGDAVYNVTYVLRDKNGNELCTVEAEANENKLNVNLSEVVKNFANVKIDDVHEVVLRKVEMSGKDKNGNDVIETVMSSMNFTEKYHTRIVLDWKNIDTDLRNDTTKLGVEADKELDSITYNVTYNLYKADGTKVVTGEEVTVENASTVDIVLSEVLAEVDGVSAEDVAYAQITDIKAMAVSGGTTLKETDVFDEVIFTPSITVNWQSQADGIAECISDGKYMGLENIASVDSYNVTYVLRKADGTFLAEYTVESNTAEHEHVIDNVAGWGWDVVAEVTKVVPVFKLNDDSSVTGAAYLDAYKNGTKTMTLDWPDYEGEGNYSVTYVLRKADGTEIYKTTVNAAESKYVINIAEALAGTGATVDDVAVAEIIELKKGETEIFVCDTDDYKMISFTLDAPTQDENGNEITSIGSYAVEGVLRKADGTFICNFSAETTAAEYEVNINEAIANAGVTGVTAADVASAEITRITAKNINGVTGADLTLFELIERTEEDDKDSNRHLEMTLEWKTLHDSLVSNLNNGTLEDAEGNKLTGFSEYRIAYIFKDEYDKQLGDVFYGTSDRSSFEVSFADGSTTADGIDYGKVGSVELVEVIWVGNDENDVEREVLHCNVEDVTKTAPREDVFIISWSEWANSKKIKDLIKDYYTITMDVINANGKVIGTFTRDIRADFTSYEVDVERVAEQLGVSSDAIKRIDLTKVEAKEYGSDNVLAVHSGLQEVVLVEYGKFCSLEWNEQHNDWMKKIAAEELRDSAGNVIASFTDYTITIALKDATGTVLKELDIADITGSTYNLDIEKIAGDNNIAFDNIAAVELVSVTLNGGHGVTEQYGKEFDLVTNGIPLMTLDWKTIDQNLRSQLDAQVLIDENGTLFAEFTSYRISYELRDAEGNRIGNVLSAETTAPSYSVDLEGVIPEGCNVDDVASVRLTAITFCGKDAAGNDLEKDYSWTQAVSMLETFVENYKAEDKALTISWYGVDPAEYGLLEIAAFEVEYILYDQNGYKMGESIAFKVDGSKNSITINGVDENTSVAWRFRVLGDDSGTTASAWSDYRTAHDVIQVSSPSKFYTENFSSSVIDANPQEDTTGVVAAIANLFWDEVQSDKAIRKYVIEYCELPDQITLDDVPVGMSLEDYIASNGTDGLFVNSAMPVYVKEVTGTEVAISDFQNQAYVYWRIKAVDVDDASSEWLAGQTFRVWTNNDTSAPVFPDVSTGLLAVTFPGVEYVEPAKDYDRKQEEGKESTYSVMVGWNRAEDSESGVRAYLVEFSTDGGKTFTQYESVDSEDVVSYSYGSWYDESLDPDTTYRIVYRNATGKECVLEADSMVKIPGNTSATANTDLVFVDVTLKEENGKLTLSWCAPSKTMDFIGQDITIEYKVGDTWHELVRNVDDFKYSTYDYTCTVDGLTGKDYQYRVVAVDYFGNKVPVSRVVSGSINSDVSDPNFVFSTTENPNPYADRTFAQYGYKEDEDNLEAEVLLSGELYWSLATDSESAVRKYVIKFSADGGKTFDDKLTQELAVADLEKSFSQLHLDNIDLTITAGKYYTVTVDGNDIIVKAEKDGVLTLDRFIEDLSGKTIVVSDDSSVSVKLNDSMVSTFEYKITEFKHEKLVAGKTYDIVLDNGDVVSATATLNNNKEAVLIVERDIFEKRITIIEHNTEIFNGMTSRENTTLFYKVDIASMNMPASGYTYEIFAYDYFGQTGKPLVGKIEADQTPPVFEKNETQVSGFVYEKPDWEPTVAGNLAETASYSTYIGWHQAVDKDDKGVPASGLRCYELRISTDGGKTWEVSATIDPDELVTRTFCSWVPAPGEEALDVECAYRVCLLDAEGKTTDTYSSAVVGRKDGSNELNLTWVADGNMKGRTFVIQKRVGASWANVSDIGTVKMSDDRDCVVYECSWEIRGMTAEEFSYQIVAKDLCGYTSYIQKDVEVDKGTPMFAKNSIRVEVGEPVKDSENNNEITLTPTFYWNPAQDQAGDVGVRYYVVRYRLKAEDGEPAGEWIVGGTIEHVAGTTEYMWAATNKLEWDVYEYEVIAYDFFGNKTTAKGTFGTPDTEGPKVFFDDEAYANIVEYEYKDATEMVARRDSEGNLVYDSNGKIIYDEVVVMVKQPVLDSNGNIVYDINGDPLMQEVPARGDLAEATVTLKWDGTFVDDSDGDILFKVTISDSMEFSPEGNTYDFWTTDTSLVFDNDTPGRNVGLFENMKQVYWRVQVYDQYYNEGDKIGARQEFYFVNDEGQQLSVSAGLTKPENIEVTYTWLTTDDQRSNTARIKWTHDEQPLGVYYYEIKLVSKSDPKLTYTASTVAKDVQNAGTDLSELVSYNKSSNTFELSDLMQLLRETDPKYTDIADGEYNLVITAYDSNGRKAASSSVNFVMDDTRPERVDRNRIEAFVVSDNLNHDKYSQPVVRWAESIDRTAGIERYELSYRIKGSNSTFETVKIDADTREFIFPSVPEGTTYEYYIIAIDKSGNRSFDWGTGVYEEITARNDDFYRDSLTAVESEPAIGWTGNRIEVKDSVGMGDPADMFKIETGKSTAITLTVDELANLLGTNDDITIEIYKIVDGNYAKAKVFKRYSVSNTGQVFSDLLLDANSTYAFKVVSKSTKNSVVDYSLVIDKKDLGGSATGNDNSDDTYERAIANHKSFVINSELHDLSSFNDCVGYGDSSDWRALSINNSGKFNFSISDAAMDVTLTVYELQENGKMKKLGSVKAGAKELDGKVLQNIVMDREGDYYLEVKANNTKSYGSDYTVTVECVESYPAATEYDDLSAVLTAPANVPKLAINSKLSAAANGEDLWGGIGDTVDYYLIDGSVYRDKEYSLKLDGTNGKEVKVAIGYFNNGKFVTIKSQTGTAGSEAVNILCSFTYDQLSKSQGKLYVQVSSNGTNANSRYTVEFKEYSNMAGADSSDDDAAVTEKYLYNGTPVDDWVGYVDAVDYREISIAENGVYEIKLDGADNNLTITVVQQVVNAKTGKISYRTVKSVKATAANNSVTTGALLLDTNEKYFVSVNATSAKKGGDSDYTLSMEKLGSTVQLEGKTVFSMNDDIQDVSSAVNYVYDAADLGGAYKFTLNNTEATGNVKLTVYELLTTGSKRTVKTLTVKAGDEGNTGYLYFDDSAAKNGTGIYQVEVQGVKSTVSGAVSISGTGYSFDKYLAKAEDVNNSFDDINWVGTGDETDSYDYTVAEGHEGIHEFKLTGFDGNSIKLKIVDANGKVLKTFTTAKNTSEATFAYDFKNVGAYTLVVEANGKGRFSEYTLSYVDRSADANGFDNSSAILGDPDSWNIDDTTKLTAANDVSGWIGLGDAEDFYGIVVDADGNYDLNIGNIENDVKVTLYQATQYNTNDDTIKSGKAIKSVTASAENGGAVLSGVYLNANEHYYVVVKAGNSKGTGNTTYTLGLDKMATAETTQSGKVGSANTAETYCFTAVAGATAISLSLGENSKSESAVVTLYEVNKVTGKYTKVKSLTANSKNLTVNTGDLCLNYDSTYVVEVTAPKVKDGKEVDFTLNVKSWNFADFDGDSDNDVMKKDKATAITLNSASELNAVWANGDAVDYYYVNADADGSYSINLNGINGNTIKVSIISVGADGKTKVLQSVTGKAGADSLILSRDLAAGQYYVKVESVGKNTASQYVLTMTQNNTDNTDDAWKQVAGKVDVTSYDTGDVITDWVGFGDATDVFKVVLDENGSADNHQIAFAASNEETLFALQNNIIEMTLVDNNGKKVALTFDKENGCYISKNLLMAGVDYYLQVKNKSPKTSNVDYGINVVEYSMFSNADDTWQQVAGDIDSVSYGTGDTITDWVGFGDAVDVFKIRLEDIAGGADNGQVVFSGVGDTIDALIGNDIELSLVDANGNSISLTFDSEKGNYTSTDTLMAGVDYYLTVKNSNEKKQNIDYNIDINLA